MSLLPARSARAVERLAGAAASLMLFLWLSPSPAIAQAVTPTAVDSALAVALAGIPGDPLSLEAALEASLTRAPAVRQSQAELVAARGGARKERGRFDPEIFAKALGSHEDLPTASPFSGADVLRNEQVAASAGTRIVLPFGTSIAASLNTTRLETNSAFASLVPQYDTFGLIEVRQPLLKGFGPSARADLSSAEELLDAAEAQNDETRAAVRGIAEEAYWDLYAAERDYAVQQVVRDGAKAVLSAAELRAHAGLVGPNQVANAQVFLAEQEQAVLDQQERLDAVSDRLASLIGRRPDGARFRPTDEPPVSLPAVDTEALVAAALERNRLVVAAAKRVSAVEALEAGARWDALPALDLVGSIGGSGLSGTGRDVVFGSDTLRTEIDGGFGDTWSQVSGRDYPRWSAGFELSVPIGLREGRGERDRLRAEGDAAREQMIAVRRSVEEQVRASQRELTNSSSRLEAARSGVAASFEQVRIGLIEYRNGRSTAFELVRLGGDLAAAQQRYSQALVRAAKAAARLRHLTYGAYPPAAGR